MNDWSFVVEIVERHVPPTIDKTIGVVYSRSTAG